MQGLTREEIAGLFLYACTNTITTAPTVTDKSTRREFLMNKVHNLKGTLSDVSHGLATGELGMSSVRGAVHPEECHRVGDTASVGQ